MGDYNEKGLNTTYAGLSFIDAIPESQRIYGRTPDILKIAHGDLGAMRYMINETKKNPLPPTKDMVFKYKSDLPRPVFVNMVYSAGDTSADLNDIFYVKAAHAIFIEEGTTLIIKNNYYNGTTYSGTLSKTNSQHEMVLVLEKRPNETHTVLTTPIVVQRGYKAAGGGVAGAPNAITASVAAPVYLAMQPKMQPVGSNEGITYGDTPFEEFNHCEINFAKWGIAKTAKNIALLQDQPIEERNRGRQLDQFWLKQEFRQRFGRRGYSQNGEGRDVYEMGGIDEYILTDQLGSGGTSDIGYTASAHVIDFLADIGPVNDVNINNMLKDKFHYGSKTKVWLMNDRDYNAISNAFVNKMRITYNSKLSMELGFRVNSFECSSGGLVHLIPDEITSINDMRGVSYILDFDSFRHTHLQNEDFVIITDAEKGMNIFEEVNYLYMNSGMKRVNPFANWKILHITEDTD